MRWRWFRRWASPGWNFNHIPGGEERPTSAGARLKRAGFAPGWSDFILLPPRDALLVRAHFLELKRRGSVLSAAQLAVAEWCVKSGTPFEIAYDFAHAIEILKRWGAVRAGIRVQ